MSSSFEKSVKGGTKVKLAPPKTKYVEHILLATQSGEAGVGEVFRTLTHRLHDSTWTVAFKALIIVHLMIKEGVPDVTLSYLASQPTRTILAVNQITDAQTQGQNIKRYSEYLRTRAQAYGHSKCDYVRAGESRMKRLPVEKGLLRETEIIQEQVKALLKCDLLNDPENEISLTAYRLLTRDLMDLYNGQNEAVMNVLSHYFEMSRPDAERAIRIYKKFCTQTAEVVQYLSVARQYSHATRLDIPKIKHAPTGLAKSLQDYLDDKDFEVNRSQYLAEQEAKRTGRPVQKPALHTAEATKTASIPQSRNVGSTSTNMPTATTQQPKGPAPDLIDFFESIEQNQQTMAQSVPQFQQQQQPQPTGFAVQQQPFGYQQDPQYANNFPVSGTNPFGQPQQQQQQAASQLPTMDFGGFGQQSHQQMFTGHAFTQEPQAYPNPPSVISPAPFVSPQQTGQQSTNPFRQSTMPTGGAPVSFSPANGTHSEPPTRQSTNPFARSTNTPPIIGNAFAQQQQQQQQQQQHQQQHQQLPSIPQAQVYSPIQPQATGTNPFTRNFTPTQQIAAPLQAQSTGTTNPFRQSAFVNQQTGQGWQYSQQPTLGGFENLETIPIFPRPATQQ